MKVDDSFRENLVFKTYHSYLKQQHIPADDSVRQLLFSRLSSHEEMTDGVKSQQRVTGITLFHCRCALVELLNEDYPLKKIKTILINRCHWNFHHVLISFEEFNRLYSHFLDCAVTKSDLFSDVYDLFDDNNKGYIRKEQFITVFSSVSPHLSSTKAEDVFSLIDVTDTKQVRTISFFSPSNNMSSLGFQAKLSFDPKFLRKDAVQIIYAAGQLCKVGVRKLRSKLISC
jgi:hypothetical protein